MMVPLVDVLDGVFVFVGKMMGVVRETMVLGKCEDAAAPVVVMPEEMCDEVPETCGCLPLAILDTPPPPPPPPPAAAAAADVDVEVEVEVEAEVVDDGCADAAVLMGAAVVWITVPRRSTRD